MIQIHEGIIYRVQTETGNFPKVHARDIAIHDNGWVQCTPSKDYSPTPAIRFYPPHTVISVVQEIPEAVA